MNTVLTVLVPTVMLKCHSFLDMLLIILLFDSLHGQELHGVAKYDRSNHHHRVDVNQQSQCTDYHLSSLSDTLQILALYSNGTSCLISVSTNSRGEWMLFNKGYGILRLRSYGLAFKFQSLDDREISCAGSIQLYIGGEIGEKPDHEFSCKDELPLHNIIVFNPKLTVIFRAPEDAFFNIGLLVSSSQAYYFSTLSGVLALCLGGSAIAAILVALIMKCCGCCKSADRRYGRERIIARLRQEGYNVTRSYGSTQQRVGPVPYDRLPNEDLTWGKMVFQPVVSQAQINNGASCSRDTPPPNYDSLPTRRVTILPSEQSAFSQVRQPEPSEHQMAANSGPPSVAQSFHSTVSYDTPNSSCVHTVQSSEHTPRNQESSAHAGYGSLGFTPSGAINSGYVSQPPPTFGAVD